MGSLRGFAAMTPEQRSAVSRKGGKRAHELGRAHTWNHDEAVKAGTEGGRVSGLRRLKLRGAR